MLRGVNPESLPMQSWIPFRRAAPGRAMRHSAESDTPHKSPPLANTELMGCNAYPSHSPAIPQRCVRLWFGLDRMRDLAIRLDLAWLLYLLPYSLWFSSGGATNTRNSSLFSDVNSYGRGTERARTYTLFLSDGKRPAPEKRAYLAKNLVSTSLSFPFACLANKRRKVAITPDSVTWQFLVQAGQAWLGRSRRCYCSFAYSALASFRMGMSGSASFQRVRKSR